MTGYRIVVVYIIGAFFLSECGTGKQVVPQRKEAEFNMMKSLNRLLKSGKKVSLYIHMVKSESGCGGSIPGTSSEGGSAGDITGVISRQLLSVFSGESGFNLVDRSQVRLLVKELELDQSGMLSSKIRNRIGRLLSVNYIIELAHQTSCQKIEKKESETYRLIELETGKIESIDLLEFNKHYNDTMEKWETDSVKLNRREVAFDEVKQKYFY